MPRSESNGVVDPAARDKYLLQVTAGPSYDTSTHCEVAVNKPGSHLIENDLMSCWLNVRIRDYHGLPRGSPETSDYFQHPTHTSDRYSIAFSFVPKKDIAGKDLVAGFDFDHSIKDRLPPGFRYAMKIVTTILDPGVYSDPYSDKPYLYGPALSSFFTFRIGEEIAQQSPEAQLAALSAEHADTIQEGADGSGQRVRADQGIPSKSSKRRKNFLNSSNLDKFTFEAGRMYHADFFNPYLDFSNFALRIPGFSISVVKYVDDKTHELRFVLKNRNTEEVLFVVIFTLLFGQKLEDVLHDKEKAVQEETQGAPKQPEDERGRPRTPLRPETSASDESPIPSSRSSSVPGSDVEGPDLESRQTAASMVANSIYSGFAALGFGRGASSAESSANTSPERPQKRLNESVDRMADDQVEGFLKSRSSAV